MNIEEALCVEVGDKLIYDPDSQKDFFGWSSFAEESIVQIDVLQPVIVSGIYAYGKSGNDTYQLGGLHLLTDTFKDISFINELYIEVEQSENLIPVIDLEFPYAKMSDQLSDLFLNNIKSAYENNLFTDHTFMDLLVSSNLHDLSLNDYISFLRVSRDHIEPVTLTQVEENHETTLILLEEQLLEGTISEDVLNQARSSNIFDAYKTQLVANDRLKDYYDKTANFCELIISTNERVTTYESLMKYLSLGLVSNSLISYNLKDNQIVRKEFLRAISRGYPELCEDKYF